MNGKKDQITNSNMCEDLSKRIRHSETRYFDELGHGSMILGKGLKEIIDSYLDFLKKKGFLKIGQD
jgi:hypothetical protein